MSLISLISLILVSFFFEKKGEKKIRRKKRRKKGKEGPKRSLPKIDFHTRNAKRNRTEIEAPKKSDFELRRKEKEKKKTKREKK